MTHSTPAQPSRPRLIGAELFAGAGGLATAAAQAGLDIRHACEIDAHAASTLRLNHPSTHVHTCDVRDAEFRTWGHVDVLTGGPPCQPFSAAGNAQGQADPRDMFPQAIRAVRELTPRAFVFENVPGLTREAFAPYLALINAQLACPDVTPDAGAHWQRRLSEVARAASSLPDERRYDVCTLTLNAADFGAPQQRHRLFFIGLRRDLGAQWRAPEVTHSRAALENALRDGTYAAEHGLHAPRTQGSGSVPLFEISTAARWRTVRDMLREHAAAPKLTLNEVFGQARAYPGHTGSALDLPAKTIKAGVHSVPGGENMVILDSGQTRYFTLREAASLQTFPLTYTFNGTRTQIMRQIGNAVPPALARPVLTQVIAALTGARPPSFS